MTREIRLLVVWRAPTHFLRERLLTTPNPHPCDDLQLLREWGLSYADGCGCRRLAND